MVFTCSEACMLHDWLPVAIAYIYVYIYIYLSNRAIYASIPDSCMLRNCMRLKLPSLHLGHARNPDKTLSRVLVLILFLTYVHVHFNVFCLPFKFLSLQTCSVEGWCSNTYMAIMLQILLQVCTYIKYATCKPKIMLNLLTIIHMCICSSIQCCLLSGGIEVIAYRAFSMGLCSILNVRTYASWLREPYELSLSAFQPT